MPYVWSQPRGTQLRYLCLAFLSVIVIACGCAGGRGRLADDVEIKHNASSISVDHELIPSKLPPEVPSNPVVQASYATPVVQLAEPISEEPEELPLGSAPQPVQLAEVIESVVRSYPLLEAALLTRDIAAGEHLSAHGGFDLKIKGATENGAVGFYETYRHTLGVLQPLYQGSSVFGGYRIGRGTFQPWYLERQTNDGGELKAGIAVPLSRNREIDGRRAALWRTSLGMARAEPEIQLQRIDFVRAASYAFWNWVAAGRRQQIAAALLKLAQDRNDAIRRKVETGDTDPPVLQDNRRLIVSREAKLIDSERKLEQAAIKLSLFLRDGSGRPMVPHGSRLSDFPKADAPNAASRDGDIVAALNNRPDLRALGVLRRQLEIDYTAARNQLLPDVQAIIAASQDVGRPATKKNDKSEFELDASVVLDVPLQRRIARGKLASAEGKLGQITAKIRMTEDKIAADVGSIYAALSAAYRQIEKARESVALANRIAEIERRKFELGESDLLTVNLREQQAAEAQSIEVDALLDYFTSQADYRAALGNE